MSFISVEVGLHANHNTIQEIAPVIKKGGLWLHSCDCGFAQTKHHGMRHNNKNTRQNGTKWDTVLNGTKWDTGFVTSSVTKSCDYAGVQEVLFQ